MAKRAKEETEEEAAAAALAAKKAAKKAKKAAAAAAAEEEEEEDPAATKKAKKVKKVAAAAAAEEEEEEDPAAAAKKAKKAKKAAAAAAAAKEEEEEEEDPAAAKKAKKAKKAAAAAAAEEEEEDPDAAKKAAKKVKKAAAAEEEEEQEEEEPEAKGKGKGKKGNNDLTVFVRGLPFATTQEALHKDFAECGEVVNCRMPLNDEGACKGIAFIEYADKEGMDKALAFSETDYGGRTIYCVPANADGGKGGDKGKGKGKKGNNDLTVFVRGLPFATTEEALRKDFAECGEVVTCRMPLNDEGACKGIAFIEYADKEGMDKAIAFNETDYGGRTIYCVPANADGKGKGKDGKDKGKGKDGKGKKGKKGKAPSEAFAKSSGAIVESTGTKQTFADSDDE